MKNKYHKAAFVSLISLSIPTILEEILSTLLQYDDTAMVGRFVDAKALAAVGSAGLLVSVTVNFIIGLSAGISVMTSRLFGEKEYDKLTGCIQTVLATLAVSGVLLTILGFFFSEQFLLWLNTPEDIMPTAETYLRISLIGLTAQLLYNAANAALRSLGNTDSALYYLCIQTFFTCKE